MSDYLNRMNVRLYGKQYTCDFCEWSSWSPVGTPMSDDLEWDEIMATQHAEMSPDCHTLHCDSEHGWE